ncbi:MAG: AlpA family phage regulatory protein [Gammaproteobacteria bacterium]|nr:AlpA family phage regulatory protein [Gammaproteobacteria bacterium]
MERLLNREQVSEIVGLKRSCIYQKIREGSFPKPLRVGKSAVRWRESSIRDWIDSLEAEG